MNRALWMLLIFGACDLPDPPPEDDCKRRTAWYPDEDGDGLGEAGDVYVGCKPPKGWVQNLGHTADTGGGA
jgi:hypothetical protein